MEKNETVGKKNLTPPEHVVHHGVRRAGPLRTLSASAVAFTRRPAEEPEAAAPGFAEPAPDEEGAAGPPEPIASCLNAALEPGDPSPVSAALGDIARARGMTQLARETGITRDGPHKALPLTGNPSFSARHATTSRQYKRA